MSREPFTSSTVTAAVLIFVAAVTHCVDLASFIIVAVSLQRQAQQKLLCLNERQPSKLVVDTTHHTVAGYLGPNAGTVLNQM